jgi:hypothetical protein
MSAKCQQQTSPSVIVARGGASLLTHRGHVFIAEKVRFLGRPRFSLDPILPMR